MKWWWQRKKAESEPRCVVTPFGKLFWSEGDGDWEGSVSFQGESLEVVVNDVSGNPDPAFIARIPELVERLPTLERTARHYVDKLSNDHYLSGIHYSAPAVQHNDGVVLCFERDEDDREETIRVSFEGNRVVDWGSVD